MSTRIVVLAAGSGTRMNAALPKVLVPFNGKPIIQHLLQSVQDSKVDPRPVIIVGESNQAAIAQAMGVGYEYVLQKEQLGTGDAVRCAEPVLVGRADAVMVLYGDEPLIKSSTIVALEKAYRQNGAVLTMMTATVTDYSDWRASLHDFARIVRDASGKIVSMVEKKDASPEELEIKEVNPALYCFDAEWLWANLPKLDNKNNQKEYYLTDLVRIAISSGETVASMPVDPREAIGVNTPEQLEMLKELI